MPQASGGNALVGIDKPFHDREGNLDTESGYHCRMYRKNGLPSACRSTVQLITDLGLMSS